MKDLYLNKGWNIKKITRECVEKLNFIQLDYSKNIKLGAETTTGENLKPKKLSTSWY